MSKKKINAMKYWQFSSLFMVMVVLGCDSSRIYETNTVIPDGVWNVSEAVEFEVEIEDTLMPANMYINIRNSGAYPYSNLFLFVNTEFPDGHRIRDTVECILASKSGWLGSGLGDIWDHQILFRRGIRFPMQGKYIISYEQAQRFGKVAYIENLPFILDVGLRIEKAK